MSENLGQHTARIPGLGHLGLSTALDFVEMGCQVIGADDDAFNVAMSQSG